MDYTYIPSLPQSSSQMFPVTKNQTMDYMMRRSSFNSRPLSEATEIQDLDYEIDYSDPESPRRSLESFGTDSATTLSLSDEPPTPGPYDARAFELPRNQSKPVQGPSGPHLFRGSMDSTMLEKANVDDWQLSMSPVSFHDPNLPLWISQEQRSPEPEHLAENSRAPSSMSRSHSASSSFVQNWTPTQVAEWMYEVGVDDNLVERFIQNDISGAVLLDLHLDDLKELDIQSFGKRHYLMNMIQTLRAASDPSSMPELARVNSSMSNNPSLPIVESPECTTSVSPDSGARHDPPSKRRGRRNRVISEDDIISPAESVSIVAIEQLLPKPHKCSKGENCTKYQKRQRKLARIAKQFPNEFAFLDGELIATTDQVVPPTPAMTQISRKSDAAPSLVASSDILGPGLLPEFHPELLLNAQNLNGVRPRDPQENVRQFLTFQHMHSPDPASTTTTKQPLEMFPPLPNQEQPHHVSNQLRSLPKLTIPNQTLCSSDPGSALRTVTPSMGARVVNSPTATQEYNPYMFDDTYRQGTPFSEMDVPVTAIPAEPLAREASQSVPPGMRFGNISRQHQAPDPIVRSRSTRPERHRRHPSVSAMTPLQEIESLSPIDNPSEMDAAIKPQAATSQHSGSFGTTSSAQKDPDVTHSGWMKKRKTTRLLRHEWQDAHFTLKGTVLAMHKDELDTQRHSRALESIDVDDYAVACSSLASSSKLTSAFKRSVLRKAANLNNGGSYRGMDETAFAFSLIPASKGPERKSIFAANGKNHHFAVKTRDDRINWMRELMLAKALKKGKEAGNEIKMNGNFI